MMKRFSRLKKKSDLFVIEQRDNYVEIGYKLPKEAVGKKMLPCATLSGLQNKVNKLTQKWHKLQEKRLAHTQTHTGGEHGAHRALLDMQDEVTELQQEMRDVYIPLAEKFGCDPKAFYLLAYNGEDFEAKTSKFKPTLVTEKEKGSFTLSHIPQDEEVEVVLLYGIDDDGGGSILKLNVKTIKASWALLLEKYGVSPLIDTFQRERLTTLESWAELIMDEDRMAELDIDGGSRQKLSDILADNEFLTSEEKSRLEEEQRALKEKVEKLRRKVKEVGQKQDIFLSHNQAQAQNSVGILNLLLEEREVSCWWDMDSTEELSDVEMIRGIKNSQHFLLFLTDRYFESWYCRLEATYARVEERPLIVVFEADSRHFGGDYVELVKKATRKFPEYADWLLSTEAIRMARRKYERKGFIAEIMKRIGRPLDSARRADGGTVQSGVEKELREEIEVLKSELTDLWSVVEKLESQMMDKSKK